MSARIVSRTVNRRAFLGTAVAASLLAASREPVLTAAPEAGASESLIDVNVSLSRWPARRLPHDETPELVDKLRRAGVTQAWAGSLEAVLHKDLAAVNQRLTEECHRHGRGLLRPFGSINPRWPDWEEELRRCAEEYLMPGVRLHPSYHGYRLDDPAFARLLRLAADRRLIVQLVFAMEDERMMHPLLRVPAVEPAPLASLMKATPSLRLVLLNALRTLRGEALRTLLAAGEVFVEIAMLEGVGGVEALLAQVPSSRVLFGSHAPLFYFESALLKLQESPLSAEQRGALRQANARRLSAAA